MSVFLLVLLSFKEERKELYLNGREGTSIYSGERLVNVIDQKHLII